MRIVPPAVNHRSVAASIVIRPLIGNRLQETPAPARRRRRQSRRGRPLLGPGDGVGPGSPSEAAAAAVGGRAAGVRRGGDQSAAAKTPTTICASPAPNLRHRTQPRVY